MKKILTYLLAFLMIGGATGHILAPEFYAPLVPHFIPLSLANVISVIAEGIIGVALIVPKYRKEGSLLFVMLMLAFLPIHLWDWTKEVPAVGPSPAPEIRIMLQLLMIYGGWWLYKKNI